MSETTFYDDLIYHSIVGGTGATPFSLSFPPPLVLLPCSFLHASYTRRNALRSIAKIPFGMGS